MQNLSPSFQACVMRGAAAVFVMATTIAKPSGGSLSLANAFFKRRSLSIQSDPAEPPCLNPLSSLYQSCLKPV